MLEKWKVVRTIWPYKDGWGVHDPAKRVIVETGLPKWQAEEIAKQMNDNKVVPGKKRGKVR